MLIKKRHILVDKPSVSKNQSDLTDLDSFCHLSAVQSYTFAGRSPRTRLEIVYSVEVYWLKRINDIMRTLINFNQNVGMFKFRCKMSNILNEITEINCSSICKLIIN